MPHYRIRIWQSSVSRVDFALPLLRAHYAPCGERIRDRDGHVHRIASTAARYPSTLTLSVLPGELALSAVSPVEGGESVLVWLERMLRYHAQLVMFCDGASLLPGPDSAGLALTRRLAYRCVLDSAPADGFALLPGLDSERVELGFSVGETGRFTDWSAVGSYEASTP